ncbi:MAG: AI-2E family transporter [Bacteroidetes bacterium]|nr:AI-2E family transporter [Bacteroidota bacterium]
MLPLINKPNLTQNQISPNKVRQILFLILILFLAIVIFKELYFMIASLLGAITLYIITSKWMNVLCTRFRLKRWACALLIILFSLLVFVLPMIWVGSISYHKIKPFVQNPEILKTALTKINLYLQNSLHLTILNESNVDKITNQALPFVQNTIGGTLNVALILVVMYITFYFFLINSVEIERWVQKHIPLKKSNSNLAIAEFKRLVFSNAVGIPLVAIIQGITGLIGYLIFGVDGAILLGILTAVFSVIPMIGAMLVWGPLALYLLAQNQPNHALGVALWGFFLIGSIDNIARFLLQKKIGDVHPLITIFGVIIGINLFGFVGLIFGPILVSMFILIVKIYTDEFGIAITDKVLEEKAIIE